jgi:hypothetical protein
MVYASGSFLNRNDDYLVGPGFMHEGQSRST